MTPYRVAPIQTAPVWFAREANIGMTPRMTEEAAQTPAPVKVRAIQPLLRQPSPSQRVRGSATANLVQHFARAS